MRAVFFTAPHRVMFAAGTLQLLLVMLFWLPELLIRSGFAPPDTIPATPLPALWLHAGLMVFGVFPFFILGFLMTALPKWMAAAAFAPRHYLPSFALLVLGWGIFYGGYAWPALFPVGVSIAIIGLVWGTAVLAGVVRSGSADRRHGVGAILALSVIVLAALLYALALQTVDADWFEWGIEVGLWAGVVPLFVVVLHRMLPFFTATVTPGYRGESPFLLLVLVWLGLAGHGVAQGLGGSEWRGLADGAAALAAARLSWLWNVRVGLRSPMLAMLHIGALWLPLGLALAALQSLLGAAGVSWGGQLPLHAVAAGFCGSILIGMSTRVTLGHSGRPIAGDRWAWPLFQAYQGVVLLRLVGEFLPAASSAAAIAWLIVFGLWARVHLPMFFKPRPDGLPG